MKRLWQRIPVMIRAIVIGYLVALVGGLGEFVIFANLKFHPEIPWMVPAAALWLWLFWRYLNGAGWPQSTRESRIRDLRAPSLSGEVWAWALVAGSLGLISVVGLGFITPRIAEIPRDAFKLSIDFASFPIWTVCSILVVISFASGIVEEVGYRGYMLSLIQRRHGWFLATMITGLIFFLDHHISHAYATYAFLPFFLAVSCVHALLVYSTGSIRPSILLHSVFDLIVIPIQYGVVGDIPVSPLRMGMDRSLAIEFAILILAGLGAIPAFRKLIAVSRSTPGPVSNKEPNS